MKKLIVIEGLDGSGKATQTQLLYERFKTLGKKIKKITFPDYDSESSSLVKMYLGGKFGDKPNDVNAYAASAFYAVDRYASYKTGWSDKEEYDIVIADRYTTSNAIHQCCKLEPKYWDEYLEWLFEFEYKKMGIPEPDIVIFLNVDLDISQELMHKRYKGNEDKKDIHEKDLDYLNKSKEVSAYCINKYNWKVIDCCNNNSMKKIDEIHEEILSVVNFITEEAI